MAAIGLALSWAGIEARKQEEQAWRPVGGSRILHPQASAMVLLLSHFLLLVYLYPSP